MTFGISTFIQSARETYLGEEYANRSLNIPTEEDLFHSHLNEDETDVQFESEFKDAVEELVAATDKLLNETENILSNKTKAQLAESLEETKKKFELIAKNLVPSKRTVTTMDQYYTRFKQIVLEGIKEKNPEAEISTEVLTAMDSFLRMSFSPIKSIIENLGDDVQKIDELFQQLEQNSHNYCPDMASAGAQLIEIPNVMSDEEGSPLNMTSSTKEASDSTKKGSTRAKKKDDSMGE